MKNRIMDVLLIIALIALGYSIYRQNTANDQNMRMIAYEKSAPTRIPGYNPWILNQYQTMADAIFSAAITENHIERKPSKDVTGVFGISEKQLRLTPADPLTPIYTPKFKLNV